MQQVVTNQWGAYDLFLPTYFVWNISLFGSSVCLAYDCFGLTYLINYYAFFLLKVPIFIFMYFILTLLCSYYYVLLKPLVLLCLALDARIIMFLFKAPDDNMPFVSRRRVGAGVGTLPPPPLCPLTPPPPSAACCLGWGGGGREFIVLLLKFSSISVSSPSCTHSVPLLYTHHSLRIYTDYKAKVVAAV